MLELNKIYNEDCLEGLKKIDTNSIDSLISDPPYSLSFMSKEWDTDLPSVDILKECLRVLKFGAWALWLMTPRQDSQLEFLLRLRQAGFNISYGSLEWLYLSGFPKAADLSLLADKKACREDLMQKLGREPTKEEFKEAWDKWREITGENPNKRDRSKATFVSFGNFGNNFNETIPNTSEAQALSGSYAGMQLKPARELIIVSQKPIAGKTYLDQALLHLKEPEHNQLGGTWLDDCRIPINKERESDSRVGTDIKRGYKEGIIKDREASSYNVSEYGVQMYKDEGRFPANIIVSDNALDIGRIVKYSITKGLSTGKNKFFNEGNHNEIKSGYNDSGDLSRYFDLDFWFENKLKELPEEQQKIFPFLYVPKASKSERNMGLEMLPNGIHGHGNLGNSNGLERFQTITKNIHPTVKSLKLMSYLITLATRENDIVLDPFIGSGTTAISSILLKRRFIGFEREEEYYKIATERIKYYQKQ